jgi:hypothetical protein
MIKREGSKFVVYSSDRRLGTHDTEDEAKRQDAAVIAARNERTISQRSLHLLGALGQVRTEMVGSREHLVVPVVALMEGVIHAVNAETPEFVRVDTLERGASSWNGKPVTLGHPKKNGTQCSAQDPAIIEAHGIGTIRNARVEGKKMLCEALIDKARAKKLHPDMYQRLAAGETEEVSVGALVVTDKVPGTFNNKPFTSSWTFAQGDHLAFLPGGRGACSVEMGCGTHRAAMRVCGDMLTLEEQSLDERIQEIQNAVTKKFGASSSLYPSSVWAQSVYDDHVIIRKDDKLFSVDYERDKDGQIVFDGEPTEVKQTYVAAEETRRAPACLSFTSLEGTTLSARIQAVQKAVDDEMNDEPEPPEPYAYASQVFDDFAIVCQGEDTFKVPYTVADDGSIELGKPVAVKQAWVAARGDAALAVLAGARHSNKDMGLIQAVHDHSMALGATCDRKNYKLMEAKIEGGAPKIKDGKMSDANRFYIDSVGHRAGRKS